MKAKTIKAVIAKKMAEFRDAIVIDRYGRAELFDAETGIYLLADGRFGVQFGDQWIVKQSLSGLKKTITKTRPVISVFCPDDDDPERFETAEIVEIRRSGMINSEGKLIRSRFSRWYLMDLTVMSQLKSLAAKRKKFIDKVDAEWDALIERLTSVHESNFKEVAAERQYANPLTGDNA